MVQTADFGPQAPQEAKSSTAKWSSFLEQVRRTRSSVEDGTTARKKERRGCRMMVAVMTGWNSAGFCIY